MDIMVGFVTASDEKEASMIAEALIGKKLAACCNIIPGIRSVYRWKGERNEGTESMVVIKTTRELVQPAIEEIKRIHSYETAAIEFVQASAASPDTVRWVNEELRGIGKA